MFDEIDMLKNYFGCATGRDLDKETRKMYREKALVILDMLKDHLESIENKI